MLLQEGSVSFDIKTLLTAYSKDLLEGSSCIGMTSTLLVLGLAVGVGGWSSCYLFGVTGTPLAGDDPSLGKNLCVSNGEIRFLIVSLVH